MSGVPHPDWLREEGIRRLKAGVSPSQVAAELGVGRSTAYQWRDDPTGEKNKARKQRYAGKCVDCGAVTNGSDGYSGQARRCPRCHHRHQHESRVWVPETVVEAIRAWHAMHGFTPSARDWNPALARYQKAPDRDLIERRYQDGAWPPTSIVLREFGSWNAGIRAAGFEPNRSGHYGRPGEDLTSFPVRRAVALYEDGLSSTQVARQIGVTGETVRLWLEASGVPRRGRSEAARTGWRTRRGRVAA